MTSLSQRSLTNSRDRGARCRRRRRRGRRTPSPARSGSRSSALTSRMSSKASTPGIDCELRRWRCRKSASSGGAFGVLEREDDTVTDTARSQSWHGRQSISRRRAIDGTSGDRPSRAARRRGSRARRRGRSDAPRGPGSRSPRASPGSGSSAAGTTAVSTPQPPAILAQRARSRPRRQPVDGLERRVQRRREVRPRGQHLVQELPRPRPPRRRTASREPAGISWSAIAPSWRAPLLAETHAATLLLARGLDQLVGEPQRQRRDRRRRVHARRRRPDAAVEDVQVRDVVRAALGVDDRRRRVVAHHRRAEQVPAGRADERRDDRSSRAPAASSDSRARAWWNSTSRREFSESLYSIFAPRDAVGVGHAPGRARRGWTPRAGPRR